MTTCLTARHGRAALRPLSCLAAAAALACAPAHALNYTWQGFSGGSWDDPGRWTLLGVPGVNDNAQINGTGTGAVIVDGLREVGTLFMMGGALGGTGTLNVGHLAFAGGKLGYSTATGGGITNVASADFSGIATLQLDYSHTLNLNGDSSWSPGGGRISISPSYSQGNQSYPSAVMNIGAGTTFTDMGTAQASVTRTIGSGTVNIIGSYVRSGLGTTSASGFNNSGTLDIREGSFAFAGGNYGNTSSGTIKVAAGSTLLLGNATLTGGSVQNQGLVSLTGGDVNVAAATAIDGAWQLDAATVRAVFEGTHGIASLALNSGTLGGTGSVHAQSLVFNAGKLGLSTATGGGTLSVAGTSSFNGTQTQQLDYSHTLNLNGDSTWTAGNGRISVASSYSQGNQTYASAVLNIGAGTTFTDMGAASAAGTRLIGTGTVNNAGHYVRQGLGTTEAKNFRNAGELSIAGGTFLVDDRFSNTGTVRLAAGTLLAASTTVLANSGTLAGFGTVKTVNGSNALDQRGTLDPGDATTLGTLTIDGRLTMASPSMLRIDLGAGGLSDRLAVTGQALLGGELALWATAGTVFQLGEVYTIATFSQRVGSVFDSISWHGLSADMFSIEYHAQDITLRVSAVPEPAAVWLWLAGGLALAWTARRRA